MATFNGTFFQIQNRSARGGEHAIPNARGAIGFTALTTSGTAGTVQRGGGAWEAPSDGYVLCRCDGAVRVAAGATATVGASPVGVLVPADETMPVAVSAGDTLSVIDA